MITNPLAIARVFKPAFFVPIPLFGMPPRDATHLTALRKIEDVAREGAKACTGWITLLCVLAIISFVMETQLQGIFVLMQVLYCLLAGSLYNRANKVIWYLAWFDAQTQMEIHRREAAQMLADAHELLKISKAEAIHGQIKNVQSEEEKQKS